ncbi:hypothetical protein [Lactobacillus psittaci]|uniref:Uncharacterized protein n=1 Tax=Lactobacillus psittaci DSM 15354 TaxID=1122152 RepID=A0A0R1S464_9LACO|nr:hypothetical protein [Lactobacillus psittaci]KRL63847.1 hypothetical protein FC23_GL000094 [Lactobacillus psittaci DSM 15354]
METREFEKRYFYGRPFPASLIDENRSYSVQNMTMEQDDEFLAFLKENDLEANRANLVVFNPDSFMYWYGAITDKMISDRHGLLKFDLPQAKVASEISEGTIANLSMPLNAAIPTFLKKVTASGIKVYENLGDSQTPYVLQMVDLNTKKLTQILYLESVEK